MKTKKLVANYLLPSGVEGGGEYDELDEQELCFSDMHAFVMEGK